MLFAKQITLCSLSFKFNCVLSELFIGRHTYVTTVALLPLSGWNEWLEHAVIIACLIRLGQVYATRLFEYVQLGTRYTSGKSWENFLLEHNTYRCISSRDKTKAVVTQFVLHVMFMTYSKKTYRKIYVLSNTVLPYQNYMFLVDVFKGFIINAVHSNCIFRAKLLKVPSTSWNFSQISILYSSCVVVVYPHNNSSRWQLRLLHADPHYHLTHC